MRDTWSSTCFEFDSHNDKAHKLLASIPMEEFFKVKVFIYSNVFGGGGVAHGPLAKK